MITFLNLTVIANELFVFAVIVEQNSKICEAPMSIWFFFLKTSSLRIFFYVFLCGSELWKLI